MDDQEAFEGDDFTFQVDCDGSPKPVAKWTKDGKGIDTKDGHFTIMQADPNAYRLIIKGIKFSFNTHLNLHIYRIICLIQSFKIPLLNKVNILFNTGVKAEDDAGEYQVEFSNRAGDKKCSAQLTVHCKSLLFMAV